MAVGRETTVTARSQNPKPLHQYSLAISSGGRAAAFPAACSISDTFPRSLVLDRALAIDKTQAEQAIGHTGKMWFFPTTYHHLIWLSSRPQPCPDPGYTHPAMPRPDIYEDILVRSSEIPCRRSEGFSTKEVGIADRCLAKVQASGLQSSVKCCWF